MCAVCGLHKDELEHGTDGHPLGRHEYDPVIAPPERAPVTLDEITDAYERAKQEEGEQ